MTEVLQRPARRQPPRTEPAGRPPLLVGAVAAAWSVAAGLLLLGLPMLVVWAADSRTGAGAADALRAVGLLWLVAQGVELSTPDGAVGLVPLGLTALPLLLLARAGRHAAQEARASTLRAVAETVAGVALPYAVLTAVVAAACRTSAADPDGVRALVAGGAVALLGATVGALRAAGLAGAAALLVPERLRAACRSALIATGVLVAGGAVLAGAALAVHAERAADLARSSATGAVGGVALLLLGLVLVPVAAVWGAAWTAGTGFAVGTGTAVSPFAHELGAVPAVPLLAALPAAPAPGWAAAALAVPVVAGALAAGRLRVPPSRAGALEAAAVGPLAGLAVAALCALAGGPLGNGRLVELGPSPWRTGLAVAALVAVGAAAVPAARAGAARLVRRPADVG